MLHLLIFRRVMKRPSQKKFLFYRYTTTGDSCSLELYFDLQAGQSAWSIIHKSHIVQLFTISFTKNH